DVGEPHRLDCPCHACRLVGIQRQGDARCHVAECAGAGADLAHDHEGSVLLVPALAYIGAPGLLTDRDELVRLHDLPRFGIAFGYRRLDADPIRLAKHGLVWPVSLFRVAGPRLAGEIENGDQCQGTFPTGTGAAPAVSVRGRTARE